MTNTKHVLISAPFGYSIKNLLYSSFWSSKTVKDSLIYIITPTPSVYAKFFKRNNIDNVKVVATDFNCINYSFFFTSLWQIVKTKFLTKSHSNTQKIKWKVLKDQSKILYYIKMLAVCSSSLIPTKILNKLLLLVTPDINLILPAKIDVWLSMAPSFEFDLMVYKKLKKEFEVLKKIAFIHSWDNISSKGPLICNFDRVIVWGNIMRNEVLEKFDYDNAQVHDIGMPQYDIWNKRDFITPKKKYILYTTGHPETIPNEKLYVQDLLETLKEINQDYKLIVRVHPNDKVENYQDLVQIYNFLEIENPGARTEKTYDKWSPEEKDMLHFGNLLFGADVVINIASTIILDASYFLKPVICFNYNKSDKLGKSVTRFYQYEHLKRLLKHKGIYKCNSREQLKNLFIQIIQNHTLKQEQVKMFKEYDQFKDGLAGKRLGNLLSDE